MSNYLRGKKIDNFNLVLEAADTDVSELPIMCITHGLDATMKELLERREDAVRRLKKARSNLVPDSFHPRPESL